jgi:flagellar basal-body rod protein FlgC
MPTDGIFTTTRIASSGLSAERQRMEVAAQNIANAHSTRSVDGGPYRRRQVVFGELLQSAGLASANAQALGGVQVLGVQQDQSPLPTMYDPGHPDANADGLVQLPNVQIPHELVDLMTASRAYEANLKSLELFRQMTEQTLGLLRGAG